jgi:dCMP deaminase
MVIRLVPDHHEPLCPAGPCNNTVHAEANAIVFAAKYGMPTDHAELYVTHAPCIICARLIINAGIMGVVYSVDYRDPAGVNLLIAAAIPTQRI